MIANGTPMLLSFDTKRLYGCDGQLKILIEPLPAAEPNGNLITKVGRLLKDREVCRVRTCFEGDMLGSELLPPDALLAERRGTLIDTVPLPIRLLLFGTGPEIEPITQLAGNLGWVIECFGHPSELAADFRPDAQTAALVMNHNFGRDLLALDRLLPLSLRYVGLLGPRKRYAEILARLSEYRPLDFEAGTEEHLHSRGTRYRQRGPRRNRAGNRVRGRRSPFQSPRRLSCASARVIFTQPSPLAGGEAA